jgi:hypothetical protein
VNSRNVSLCLGLRYACGCGNYAAVEILVKGYKAILADDKQKLKRAFKAALDRGYHNVCVLLFNTFVE